MSVKYRTNYNNSTQYLQFRYMGTSTAADFTNTANWQGVDEEPTAGSRNLVESGGVFNYIQFEKLFPNEAIEGIKGNGWLNADGTFASSGNHYEYEIPEGCKLLFLSGRFVYNSSISNYWVLDENNIILLNEVYHYPPITYNNKRIKVPEGGKYIFVSQSDILGDISVYDCAYLDDFVKNANNKLTELDGSVTALESNLEYVNAQIDNDIIPSITNMSSVVPIIVSSGYLKTDGTIGLSGTTTSKFDIPSGISEIYLSGNYGVTPNKGWCVYWLVNSSGEMLYYLEETNPLPQSYNNFKIIIPNDENIAQLWTNLQSADLALVQGYVSSMELKNKINNINSRNQWYCKKIVWLGTSIPYGQSSADGGRAAHPYPNQIGERLNCTIENNAVPGLAVEAVYDSQSGTWFPSTSPDSGSLTCTIQEYAAAGIFNPDNKSYENSLLNKNADLYVFDCEPNNNDGSLIDLNNFDLVHWKYNDNSSFASHRDTYVGAMLYLLNVLWTEKPDAKVVFVGEFGSSSTYTTDSIRDASIALCNKLSIHYIDLWTKLYYNPLNKSQYINSDGVHPKQTGYDRMANILANELLLIS